MERNPVVPSSLPGSDDTPAPVLPEIPTDTRVRLHRLVDELPEVVLSSTLQLLKAALAYLSWNAVVLPWP